MLACLLLLLEGRRKAAVRSGVAAWCEMGVECVWTGMDGHGWVSVVGMSDMMRLE